MKIITRYEIINAAIQLIGHARDSARDAPKLAVSAAKGAKEDNLLEMPDHALIMEIADEASDTERRQIVFVATWVAGESLYQAASLVPGLEALFDVACRIRSRVDRTGDEPVRSQPSYRQARSAGDDVFRGQIRRRRAGKDAQFQLRKELEETGYWRLLPREGIAFAEIQRDDPNAEMTLAADEAKLAEQSALVAKFLDALATRHAVVSAYNECFRRSRAAGVPFGEPIRELSDDQIRHRPARLVEYVEMVTARIALVDAAIDAAGNAAPAMAKPVEAPKPPPVEAAPLKPAPTAAPAVATTEPATPTTNPTHKTITAGYDTFSAFSAIATVTQQDVETQFARVQLGIPRNAVFPNFPTTLEGILARAKGNLREALRLVYELEVRALNRYTGNAAGPARVKARRIEAFLGQRTASASTPAPAATNTNRDASAAA